MTDNLLIVILTVVATIAVQLIFVWLWGGRSESNELKPLKLKKYLGGIPKGAQRERAVAAVLDIRKFEIELYWHRAAYFWAFILLAYTGFALAVTAEPPEDTSELANGLAPVIALLGFAISFAWHLVNKGSKFWQENWENHLDLLEDDQHGKLYKTIVSRPDPVKAEEAAKQFLIGPSAFSVSKIHSIVSLLNLVVWGLLIANSSPLRLLNASQLWQLLAVSVLASVACMLAWGRTEARNHGDLVARRRKVSVKKPKR